MAPKWVAPGKPLGPAARPCRFQHFVGWESHHVDHNMGLIWADDPERAMTMPGHDTDALTDIALRQLELAAQSDAPFFLMISYQAPHPPCSPPEPFRSLYDNRDLMTEPNADQSAWYRMPHWNADYDVASFCQRYFAEISHLDASFGRLL